MLQPTCYRRALLRLSGILRPHPHRCVRSTARAKDDTEIKQAEDALAKAKLEMEKVELLSRIDAEKAQEDLDEAQATLAQLKQTYDLKRKAAQASIRILEIQRDRTRETMLPTQRRAARALLLVPALDARLLQQLAVLLLRHTLAALLDD